MRNILRTIVNYSLLIGLLAILFSFAMFQGGFVSWFLLYSFIPIFLYYMGLFLYPLKRWKVRRELSRSVVSAGNTITVNIIIKRMIPFPIVYGVFEQMISDSLHKKDTRHEKHDFSGDKSLVDFTRELKQLFFPWFRRTIRISFELPYLPRGEHELQALRVYTRDLFGFVKKEHSFQLSDQFVVYPAERTAHITRQASKYEEGSTATHTVNLSNTNVATGVREYIPGDKFSWIDWKQTARQQEIMTKEFEEEKSVDMMAVLDGSYHADLNPVAFEGAVELTVALMEAFSKHNMHVGLLSLGEQVNQFSVQKATLNREHIMHHLARIQPVGNQQLSLQLQEEMIKLDNQYIFIFITTILDDEVKRAIDQLQSRSERIVILYVHGKQSINQQEEANLHYMLTQNIDVCVITEQQLQHDPIEVKF